MEKHGEGSYWEHLPTLSRLEKLQNDTQRRFMSQRARYQFKKFSDQVLNFDVNENSFKGPQLLNKEHAQCTLQNTSQNVKLENYKVSNIISNSESVKGERSSGKKLKKIPESIEQSSKGKWVKEYERRVLKLSIENSDNDTDKPPGKSSQQSKTVATPNSDDLDISSDCNVAMHSCCSNHSVIYSKPQEWPKCAERSNFCFKCHAPCHQDNNIDTVVGCKFCSAVIHLKCLERRSSHPGSNIEPDGIICPDCKREIQLSKMDYKIQKKTIYKTEVISQK